MPSKLGIHAILPGETLSVIERLMEGGARMSTVKAVAAPGWLKEVKALDPEIVTIGRFIDGVNPDIEVEMPSLKGDLRAKARRVMDNVLPLWEEHRDYVDYWEIINELDPVGTEGHRRLAEFMIYCIEIANAAGYRLGLFSYSLGVPEWDEMQAVVETGVFRLAKDGGHMFSLHEYAYPIDKWFGDPMPGVPAYPDRGSLACRYRWWYEELLKPRDEVIPAYITEVNLLRPMQELTASEWIEQMAWYDRRMREDYYVGGAHIFTLGSIEGWENFEFGRFLPHLTHYMTEIKDTQDPAWPEPEPAPPEEEEQPTIPGPEEPRLPYERHYLLLPPGADWQWVAACSRYWETFRVTIGGSADDAAHGPGLTQRAVTAINPHWWDGDLEAFFNTHYPGILYDPIKVASPDELALYLNRRVALKKRFG